MAPIPSTSIATIPGCRIFGTWKEEEEAPTYGLTVQLDTTIHVHFLEVRRLWWAVRDAA